MTGKKKITVDEVTEKTEPVGVTVSEFEEFNNRLTALEENVAKDDCCLCDNNIESRLSTLEQRIAAGDTKYPSNTRDYTVKEGDTLALIAKRELGNAGNLNQIVIMNYDRYPSFRRGIVVEEGWVLRLPPR